METLPVPLVCCDLCTCNKATPTSKQASQPSQGEDSNKQQLAWRRWACAADASKTVYACLFCSTHFTSAILAIKCAACSSRLHGCSFQADRSIRQPIALEKRVFALQIGMPSHTPISDDTQKLQKDTETCIALPIHVTIWLLWYVHVAE